MPEGDTIYRAARAIEKALGGKVITAFETGLAMLANVNDNTSIVGRIVEKVEARGKWCLIFLSGDMILVTHMLMSGSWHIYRTGERWRMNRSRMRVALACGDYQAVAFNVPIAEFHSTRSLERNSQIPKLGPDILSKEFSTTRAVKWLSDYAASRPNAEIAVALLNQRALAGLGNVYKSEVAFAVGVNPFRRMSTITLREMEAMVEVAQCYMLANVTDGARAQIVTYSGNRRTTRAMSPSDRLWVYGRGGEECWRCGGIIIMRKQGEQARSTYWCPSCQPWIEAADHPGEAPEPKTALLRLRRRPSC